jgi:hypothetical protein
MPPARRKRRSPAHGRRYGVEAPACIVMVIAMLAAMALIATLAYARAAE